MDELKGLPNEPDPERDHVFWIWFWISVAISILLHVGLFYGLAMYSEKKGIDLSKDTGKIETRFVTPSQLQALQQRSRQRPPGAPPSPSRAARPEIVESAPAKSVKPPQDKARFLGERTQRVEKETRSATFGSVTGGKGGPSKELTPKNDVEKPPSEKRTADTLKKLGLSPNGIFPVDAKEEEREQKAEAPAGDARLTHGSMDALSKDIAIGADTVLNTDEYVFASFFNRVKREVGPRWEPIIQGILGDPARHLRQGLYITETNFWLNAGGEVVRVEISRPSGEARFDEAARQALMKLPVMKNIPDALRESDGTYRMQLGFVVDLESSGFRTDYVPDPRL